MLLGVVWALGRGYAGSKRCHSPRNTLPVPVTTLFGAFATASGWRLSFAALRGIDAGGAGQLLKYRAARLGGLRRQNGEI